VIVEMFGLAMGADQSTLGEWLRPQFPKNVEAVLSVNRDFVAEAAFLKIQGSDLFIATGPKQIPSSGGALRTAEAQSRQIQFVLRVLFVLTACCFAAPCRLYRAGEDFFGIWSIDRPRLRRLKAMQGARRDGQLIMDNGFWLPPAKKDTRKVGDRRATFEAQLTRHAIQIPEKSRQHWQPHPHKVGPVYRWFAHDWARSGINSALDARMFFSYFFGNAHTSQSQRSVPSGAEKMAMNLDGFLSNCKDNAKILSKPGPQWEVQGFNPMNSTIRIRLDF
jgi:hypothetical protein